MRLNCVYVQVIRWREGYFKGIRIDVDPQDLGHCLLMVPVKLKLSRKPQSAGAGDGEETGWVVFRRVLGFEEIADKKTA